MLRRAVDPAAAARDLRLQRDDPGLQLGDGQTIQVLRQQRGQRIARARAEDVVEVHERER